MKALAKSKALPLFAFADTREQGEEGAVQLPDMPLSEHVVNDYQTLKLSLKAHPMQFLRGLCQERKVTDNAKLKTLRNGAPVSVAGVVLVRNGRPEERHDAIAHHLVDSALVAVHGLHHVFKDRVQ